MDGQEDTESIQLLEERLNNKISVLYKYKQAQLTLKIVIFTAISCILFVRSGKGHDIYLWFLGIFMALIALSEFFELEEFRFYSKDNKSKKVSINNQDNK